MKEIWKPIPSWPEYSASNLGRIRTETRRVLRSRKKQTTRLVQSKILSQLNNYYGYPCVKIRNRTFSVHRLTLEAFTGPRPEGMECRHLDGVRDNNNVSNLCWGTSSENYQDQIRHGTALIFQGESNWAAKLNDDKVREIRRSKLSCPKLGKKFGVCAHVIWAARTRKTWRHVRD